MRLILIQVIAAVASLSPVWAAEGDSMGTSVYRLWPGPSPRWNAPSEMERDTTAGDGRLAGGRPVVRLGFVKEPQLHVYQADPQTASDTIVIISWLREQGWLER